jgi:hypothetical protein
VPYVGSVEAKFQHSYFSATFLQSSSSFITFSNSSDFLEKASDAMFNS